jgi:hypothetical protein
MPWSYSACRNRSTMAYIQDMGSNNVRNTDMGLKMRTVRECVRGSMWRKEGGQGPVARANYARHVPWIVKIATT